MRVTFSSLVKNHPVALTSIAFAVAMFSCSAMGKRWAVAQFVAVSIIAPVAARLKRSGKMEDVGEAVGDLVDAACPSKVDRPEPPPPDPASPFTAEKIAAIHSPGPVPWQLTCADGPKSEPLPPVPKPEPHPPIAHWGLVGAHITAVTLFVVEAKSKPKKRRKRK